MALPNYCFKRGLDKQKKDLDHIIFPIKLTSYDPITTVDKNFTKIPKQFWAYTFWIWIP